MASGDLADANDAIRDLQECSIGYLLAIAQKQGPTAEAEDVVAQAFIELLPFISSNTPIRNMKGLLARITRLRAIDALRRQHRTVVESLNVAAENGQELTSLDTADDPYEAINRVEEAHAIANVILDALLPEEREILSRRHMVPLSVAETASELNITEDQVKKRTQQAIASARRIAEARELRHD